MEIRENKDNRDSNDNNVSNNITSKIIEMITKNCSNNSNQIDKDDNSSNNNQEKNKEEADLKDNINTNSSNYLTINYSINKSKKHYYQEKSDEIIQSIIPLFKTPSNTNNPLNSDRNTDREGNNNKTDKDLDLILKSSSKPSIDISNRNSNNYNNNANKEKDNTDTFFISQPNHSYNRTHTNLGSNRNLKNNNDYNINFVSKLHKKTNSSISSSKKSKVTDNKKKVLFKGYTINNNNSNNNVSSGTINNNLNKLNNKINRSKNDNIIHNFNKQISNNSTKEVFSFHTNYNDKEDVSEFQLKTRHSFMNPIMKNNLINMYNNNNFNPHSKTQSSIPLRNAIKNKTQKNILINSSKPKHYETLTTSQKQKNRRVSLLNPLNRITIKKYEVTEEDQNQNPSIIDQNTKINNTNNNIIKSYNSSLDVSTSKNPIHPYNNSSSISITNNPFPISTLSNLSLKQQKRRGALKIGGKYRGSIKILTRIVMNSIAKLNNNIHLDKTNSSVAEQLIVEIKKPTPKFLLEHKLFEKPEYTETKDILKMTFLLKNTGGFKKFMSYNQIDDESIRTSCNYISHLHFKDGEFIFHQGDKSYAFFGIIKGEVELIKVEKKSLGFEGSKLSDTEFVSALSKIYQNENDHVKHHSLNSGYSHSSANLGNLWANGSNSGRVSVGGGFIGEGGYAGDVDLVKLSSSMKLNRNNDDDEIDDYDKTNHVIKEESENENENDNNMYNEMNDIDNKNIDADNVNKDIEKETIIASTTSPQISNNKKEINTNNTHNTNANNKNANTENANANCDIKESNLNSKISNPVLKQKLKQMKSAKPVKSSKIPIQKSKQKHFLNNTIDLENILLSTEYLLPRKSLSTSKNKSKKKFKKNYSSQSSLKRQSDKLYTVKEIPLTILKEGNVFGEWGLIYNKDRACCAKAKGEVDLFVVDRNCFNLSFKKCLVRAETDRKLFILNVFTYFSKLGRENFDTIYKKMVAIQLSKNEVVFREGQTANSIYFIYQGECYLTKSCRKTKETVEIKRMLKGDIFGLETTSERNFLEIYNKKNFDDKNKREIKIGDGDLIVNNEDNENNDNIKYDGNENHNNNNNSNQNDYNKSTITSNTVAHKKTNSNKTIYNPYSTNNLLNNNNSSHTPYSNPIKEFKNYKLNLDKYTSNAYSGNDNTIILKLDLSYCTELCKEDFFKPLYKMHIKKEIFAEKILTDKIIAKMKYKPEYKASSVMKRVNPEYIKEYLDRVNKKLEIERNDKSNIKLIKKKRFFNLSRKNIISNGLDIISQEVGYNCNLNNVNPDIDSFIHDNLNNIANNNSCDNNNNRSNNDNNRKDGQEEIIKITEMKDKNIQCNNNANHQNHTSRNYNHNRNDENFISINNNSNIYSHSNNNLTQNVNSKTNNSSIKDYNSYKNIEFNITQYKEHTNTSDNNIKDEVFDNHNLTHHNNTNSTNRKRKKTTFTLKGEYNNSNNKNNLVKIDKVDKIDKIDIVSPITPVAYSLSKQSVDNDLLTNKIIIKKNKKMKLDKFKRNSHKVLLLNKENNTNKENSNNINKMNNMNKTNLDVYTQYTQSRINSASSNFQNTYYTTYSNNKLSEFIDINNKHTNIINNNNNNNLYSENSNNIKKAIVNTRLNKLNDLPRDRNTNNTYYVNTNTENYASRSSFFNNEEINSKYSNANIKNDSTNNIRNNYNDKRAMLKSAQTRNSTINTISTITSNNIINKSKLKSHNRSDTKISLLLKNKNTEVIINKELYYLLNYKNECLNKKDLNFRTQNYDIPLVSNILNTK